MTAQTIHHINDVLNDLAAPAPAGFWFEAAPEPEPVEHDDACDCHFCNPCRCGICEECTGMSLDDQVEDAWSCHQEWRLNHNDQIDEAWDDFRGWPTLYALSLFIDRTTRDLWSEWERLHKNLRFYMEVKQAQHQLAAAKLQGEIEWYEWWIRKEAA